MKDAYPKKKFKPHWMGLLKNPDFWIYPYIWHLCIFQSILKTKPMSLQGSGK